VPVIIQTNGLPLNLDVTLEPGYLRLCAQRLADDPGLGGVTGKLLRPAEGGRPIIDTTGHLVYRSRRAVDRGEGETDQGQYDAGTRVFGVCGAAPMYRRAMLEETELEGEYFDEDFFAYFEDFDLSFRARLAGWDFAFVPEAVGRHHRGATGAKSSTRILALNHVNRLFVMVKNDHPLSFLRHLPGIAYTEVRATAHMLSRRPAALGQAWFLFFSSLGKFLKKRRLIQGNRKVAWQQLEPWFEPYHYGMRATLDRARRRRSAGAERLAR
jgi:GT2 family glycosyltransferase